MFARLAHDLELTCKGLSGKARRLDARSLSGSASLEMPIGAIEVAGTLQGDRVDERGLSAGDKKDCLEKMRKDVFQAGPAAVVRVEVTLEAGSARLRVTPPNGRAVERTVRPNVSDEDGGRVRVKGQIDLSLAALGSAPVKGPMNAFRVKDRVDVLFDVVFAPTAPIV
jgi:hypothetical protein